VPVLSYDNQGLFSELWTERIPVVIQGLQSKLQGAWDPASFVSAYGHLTTNMIQIGSEGVGKYQNVTIREFFGKFSSNNQERGSVVKMKVLTRRTDQLISVDILIPGFSDVDHVQRSTFTRI
jgi:hypothetical protein